MNELHSFATRRTHMLAIDILPPIANVTTPIVIQTGLALEYLVFTAIAEVIRRAVERIWIELGLLVRTLDCAVDDGGLGRDKHGRKRAIGALDYDRRHFGGCWRGRAHRLRWPHARLVRLRVPQAIATLQNRVKTRQTVVVDVTVVGIRIVAVRVPLFN